jgi:hypothetical protein
MVRTVKAVHITANIGNGKSAVIDTHAVHSAVKSLQELVQKVGMLHVSISYQHGDKKKANFDSKDKAISWLNLHDTKE